MTDDAHTMETDDDIELGNFPLTDAEKDDRRTHHNLLERRRRENIKDGFNTLGRLVPSLDGGNSRASRVVVLKKTTAYIKTLKTRNLKQKEDIDHIRAHNHILDDQLHALEKIKAAYEFSKSSAPDPPTKQSNQDEYVEVTTDEINQLEPAIPTSGASEENKPHPGMATRSKGKKDDTNTNTS